MAGYTPLFSSLTTGTLCGRWPDIGLWPIVLSMADKDGVVDVTPAYIAGVTGLPLPDVVACMKRFCEPDPYSRSTTDNGARLILLDDHRDWGWRIVNHGKYREKARLASKNAREVEEGRNRDRMRARPAETADDRRPPPETAADHLSYANANANADSGGRSAREGALPPDVSRETLQRIRDCYPPGTYREADWLLAERAIRKRCAEGVAPADLVAAAAAYGLQQQAIEKVGTQYVLKPSNFFGTDEWRGPFPTPAKPETAMDRLQRMTGASIDSRVIDHEPDFGRFISNG